MFLQELSKMIKESSSSRTIEIDMLDDDNRTIEKFTSDVQAWAKKHGVKAKLVSEFGPAGGNPLFSFTGPEKNLRALYAEYAGFDKDDSDFDEMFGGKQGGVKESYDQDREEESTIRSVLSRIESRLPHDARYKYYEVYPHKKEVTWVTQESDEEQSQEAANIIAKALSDVGIKGYTVKVVLRDLVRQSDEATPWKKAHTDGPYEPSTQEVRRQNAKFVALNDEDDLEKYDESGRNTKHIRRYSREVGPVTYVQASGDGMPILAVWYDHAGTGSAPLTGAFTSIDAYIDADPHSPSNYGRSY